MVCEQAASSSPAADRRAARAGTARLIGSIDPAARRAAGYRWFNALPAAQAVQCLAGAGLEPGLAAGLAGRRPLTDGWPDARPGPAASYQPFITMLDGKPGRS